MAHLRGGRLANYDRGKDRGRGRGRGQGALGRRTGIIDRTESSNKS